MTKNSSGRYIGAYTPEGRETLRNFTVPEACRLQTVKDDFFEGTGVKDYKALKMLGLGFTVDVISHILEGIK